MGRTSAPRTLIAVTAVLLAACGGAQGTRAEPPAALNGEWLLTAGTTPEGELELDGDGTGDDRGFDVTLTSG
ncbi:MAG: hypothetical protein WEB03_07490 [Nitriliruptor sp.]|uniref:hypothetical protein n=1 Tax=Nitriliruptor sp. TaxID=2448056 RepID=UPI0034A088A4